MPIGKNAIKRVENNGYSKVKTSAPDMENSHVIAAPDPQVTEKLIAPVEKKTAKKVAEKKAAKKAAPAKKEVVKAEAPKKAAAKPATKKPAAKKTKPVAKQDGFNSVELGKDLPYYLL
jgi:membrane protein involved in colicin uptake